MLQQQLCFQSSQTSQAQGTQSPQAQGTQGSQAQAQGTQSLGFNYVVEAKKLIFVPHERQKLIWTTLIGASLAKSGIWGQTLLTRQLEGMMLLGLGPVCPWKEEGPVLLRGSNSCMNYRGKKGQICSKSPKGRSRRAVGFDKDLPLVGPRKPEFWFSSASSFWVSLAKSMILGSEVLREALPSGETHN